MSEELKKFQPPKYKKLSVGPIVKEKTFFYIRKDGAVFPCSEKEASKHHGKLKQYGVSDGSERARVLHEASERGEMKPDELREINKAAIDAEMAAAKGRFERPRSFAGKNIQGGSFANSNVGQVLGNMLNG